LNYTIETLINIHLQPSPTLATGSASCRVISSLARFQSVGN